MYNHDIVIYN